MRMEGKELEKEGLQLGHELQEAFFWFHRHPELSYEEYQTTEKIREFLTEHGIGIMDSELETGLIAVIHGEREGAVRALRCDIDALPILEESGVPYASETKGKMHACGHDFHITSGLGCAALLQQNRKALAGTVKIIFQPAEESAKGAEKITETDLIDDVELIWGFHADPTNPVGTIGIREGYVAAAADRFLIKITGKGCHGAHPDTGIDPIPAAAAMVQAFQTVVTRNSDAFHPTLISVTRIEAGNTWNVVPETAELEGTVRTMNWVSSVIGTICSSVFLPISVFCTTASRRLRLSFFWFSIQKAPFGSQCAPKGAFLYMIVIRHSRSGRRRKPAPCAGGHRTARRGQASSWPPPRPARRPRRSW